MKYGFTTVIIYLFTYNILHCIDMLKVANLF